MLKCNNINTMSFLEKKLGIWFNITYLIKKLNKLKF